MTGAAISASTRRLVQVRSSSQLQDGVAQKTQYPHWSNPTVTQSGTDSLS